MYISVVFHVRVLFLTFLKRATAMSHDNRCRNQGHGLLRAYNQWRPIFILSVLDLGCARRLICASLRFLRLRTLGFS